MTVAEAKAWLTEYMDGERELFMQYERLELLREKMYNVGSPEMTDMPKAPSPEVDKLSLLVSRDIDLSNKIDQLVEEQTVRRVRIEKVVDALSGPDLRAVIRLRYLDGESWEKINSLMFGSDDEFFERVDSFMRRVFVIHGNALREVADIMTHSVII